jgi:carbonic anhydrase/acetyltransferase-like protein (isoleucine patch superfamily)
LRPKSKGIFKMKYKLMPKGKNGLHQIKALIDIPHIGVTKGDLGGFVENDKNLSQYDNCWVHNNAQVSGNARVYGNAWVHDNAQVYGDARVCSNAQVYNNAKVHGNAWVYGNARVSGNAQVQGDAQVSGNAQVQGDAQVSGNAWAYGNAQVQGDAQVSGNAQVQGDAQVSGNAWVYGNAQVCGTAQIINVIMAPYSVTITPQNIVIGCQMRPRFGTKAKRSFLNLIEATPELRAKYLPLLSYLRKQVPRKRAVK